MVIICDYLRICELKKFISNQFVQIWTCTNGEKDVFILMHEFEPRLIMNTSKFPRDLDLRALLMAENP